MNFKNLLLSLAASACAFSALAERPDSIRWQATLNADFSHGPNNPFWFAANKHGLSSLKPNNGYLSLAAFKDEAQEPDFSWGAGVELAVPWNFTSNFVIQQLYGEVRYRCLDLMVGSKNMEGPISDPELSSGNLIHSGNARPIPQVRAGIFDYADIWGLKGWLAVKGYLAYGAFTDSHWQEDWVGPKGKYNKNVLYCGRGIWLRNGNPEKFPLVFEAGIEMVTQFAGESYNYLYYGSGGPLVMPKNLKAFAKALIPKGGDSSTIWSERANVQGNMLGAWNFALSWTPLNKEWSVKAYYQHMFEDHSMLYIDYPWKDGLYGVEGRLPENRFVSKLLYEFLYAKDQSGSVNWTVSDRVPGHAAGADSYYHHNIYTGWEHWGMGIGNPLSIAPLYNDPRNLTFLSTRIISHHFGISGNPTDDISWRLLMSYTRSWGTYNNPYPEVKNMFNALAEVTWKPSGIKILRGWEGSLGLAMDRGNMVGHNYGLQLSITKRGIFKF